MHQKNLVKNLHLPSSVRRIEEHYLGDAKDMYMNNIFYSVSESIRYNSADSTSCPDSRKVVLRSFPPLTLVRERKLVFLKRALLVAMGWACTLSNSQTGRFVGPSAHVILPLQSSTLKGLLSLGSRASVT
jgi:hypothetical protein